MTSKDPAEDSDYVPRPHDFLVEPLFAPLEKTDPGEVVDDGAEVKPRGLLSRLFGWLIPRKSGG
ncbi:MAG: hypothetical protein ACI9D0_001745 [Bacteroidia bacterium]|jgi:hypothetical protein